LIVGGAVTMVKEQAPDNYARLLVLHDFVVLTFDYASYGESEGSLRNNENVQGKLKDLKAGVSYLQTLPFVGEIGVLGACTTGGNAAYLAADDDRIAAMAAVVPWMYEPALAEPIWGKEVITRNDAKAKDARERFAKTGEYLSTQIFTNTPDIEGFMLGQPLSIFLIRLAASRLETGKMKFSGVHGMNGLTCMTLLARLLKSKSLF
jgi:hypothetical protein